MTASQALGAHLIIIPAILMLGTIFFMFKEDWKWIFLFGFYLALMGLGLIFISGRLVIPW